MAGAYWCGTAPSRSMLTAREMSPLARRSAVRAISSEKPKARMVSTSACDGPAPPPPPSGRAGKADADAGLSVDVAVVADARAAAGAALERATRLGHMPLGVAAMGRLGCVAVADKQNNRLVLYNARTLLRPAGDPPL